MRETEVTFAFKKNELSGESYEATIDTAGLLLCLAAAAEVSGKKKKSEGIANGKCSVTDIWPSLPLIP